MAQRGVRRRSEGLVQDDLVTFGKRLRDYRKRLGLTQEDLSGDRYSAAYISHLEAGKREPSNEAIGYIADRLGISVEELWSGRSVDWAVEMAEDLRARGLPREAYGLLERTLTNLERAGQVSPYVLSVMHRELGLSERRNDPVVAEKHLREAAELALTSGGPVAETALTLLGLGNVLADQGDSEGAAASYRQAAEMLVSRFPPPRVCDT